MNNCLILGFGRSGTSLLAGLLYHSGYFAGNHLHPPRATNPRGFYEDIIINRINEQILEPYDYSKLHADYPVFSKEFNPYHPRRGHRWLALIKPGAIISCQHDEIKSQIRKAVTQQQPFVYKDPRFNYSLPVWIDFLPKDTCCLCVFRNPANVVRSVIKECNPVEYLSDFYIDEELCYQIWYNSYRHLLDTMSEEIRTRTLFISYERLLQNHYTEEMSRLLNARIYNEFIDPSLSRTKNIGSMPASVARMFAELNSLAGVK